MPPELLMGSVLFHEERRGQQDHFGRDGLRVRRRAGCQNAAVSVSQISWTTMRLELRHRVERQLEVGAR